MWAEHLNLRWPERRTVVQHIKEQINALPFSSPQVVELCAGHGVLAEALLTWLPHIRYIGFDSSALLLNVAQDRLIPFGNRAQLIGADLNTNDWLRHLDGDIQAIVSMQSLHDLGGEVEVNRIYRLAKERLVPGGLFLNADLVVSPGQDKPNIPGRRSIPRHLELLRSHGYERVTCTLEQGEFGCCVAFVANTPFKAMG